MPNHPKCLLDFGVFTIRYLGILFTRFHRKITSKLKQKGINGVLNCFYIGMVVESSTFLDMFLFPFFFFLQFILYFSHFPDLKIHKILYVVRIKSNGNYFTSQFLKCHLFSITLNTRRSEKKTTNHYTKRVKNKPKKNIWIEIRDWRQFLKCMQFLFWFTIKRWQLPITKLLNYQFKLKISKCLMFTCNTSNNNCYWVK